MEPLHLKPVFEDFLFFSHTEEEAVSERLFSRGICVPSGSYMTLEQ